MKWYLLNCQAQKQLLPSELTLQKWHLLTEVCALCQQGHAAPGDKIIQKYE